MVHPNAFATECTEIAPRRISKYARVLREHALPRTEFGLPHAIENQPTGKGSTRMSNPETPTTASRADSSLHRYPARHRRADQRSPNGAPPSLSPVVCSHSSPSSPPGRKAYTAPSLSATSPNPKSAEPSANPTQLPRSPISWAGSSPSPPASSASWRRHRTDPWRIRSTCTLRGRHTAPRRSRLTSSLPDPESDPHPEYTHAATDSAERCL